MAKSGPDSSLDTILMQLGDFGKYQAFVFSLVCFAVVLHSAVHVAYVFTAMDLDYRCEIPGCDLDNKEYIPLWLTNAVPFSKEKPAKCDKYFQKYPNVSDGTCLPDDFDERKIEKCSKFVYRSEEKSILQSYNLQCDNNLWKLAMVGTMNSIGQFVGLFISGIFSDRYGRRIVLVWGMVMCAVCGLLRTLMPTYEWFLLFEFLDAAFGAGTYICGFVLGVELVGPKNRVLTGVISSSCYAVGEVFTAVSAWLVQSWRPLIFILYTPPFLLLSYLWIVPESIRWNLSKGRIEEAKATLRKVAKINGREISESALEKLNVGNSDSSQVIPNPYKEAFKSTILLLRLVNCCFCWITCTFLFYGLTLNSVTLAAGNSYLDFILTSLVEIPAYVSCHYMLDLFGRRMSLCGSYVLTGVACVGFMFITSDSHAAGLTVYLLGKFGATAAFTNLYVLTSEIFPTNMRQSFMGVCSMFGRIGSMISPQMPLLARVWEPLPLLSFAVMSLLAGCLTLVFPETLNVQLPDTIEEAENISKLPKKTQVHPEHPHIKC